MIMACYVVAEVKVTNPDEFQKYGQLAVPNIIAFGGKVLVAGQPDTVEGDWKPERIAIVEFPSVEQAMAWYYSPEYSALKKIRERAAIFNVILGPGLSA
jgi:uncharacterized protein (DUF1330 family)